MRATVRIVPHRSTPMRRVLAPLLLLLLVSMSVVGPLSARRAKQRAETWAGTSSVSPEPDFIGPDWPKQVTAQFPTAYSRGQHDAETSPDVRILVPEEGGRRLVASEPQLSIALALVRLRTGQPVSLHHADSDTDEDRAYITGHYEATMRRLDAGQFRGRSVRAWTEGEALIPFTCPIKDATQVGRECRRMAFYLERIAPSDSLPSSVGIVWVRATIDVEDDGHVRSVRFDSAQVEDSRVSAATLPASLLQRLGRRVRSERYLALPPAYRGMNLRSSLRDVVWVE